MNYTYDELRSRISILDFAQAHGYSVNRKKGLRWPVLEHGSGDKIIIINPRDSQNQGYFNPNQDGDKGTLIQFVTNRLGWLFPQDQSQSTPWNVNQVLHQWLNMPFRERLYQSKTILPSKHGGKVDEVVFNKSLLRPLKDYRWLKSRGISKETIESPQFKDNILQVRAGNHVNTAFPYRAVMYGEMLGAEIRNHQYKGHMAGSKRTASVWFSNPMPETQRIVICESALDCLSHFEMTHDPGNMYISFGGQLTQGQIMVIKELHRDLSAHRHIEILIGVDMDQKGEEYSAVLSKAFTNAQKLPLDTKDQNEALMINRRLRRQKNVTQSI
jgi:Protein of unknown function (DUF3991)/Toprim-like